MAPRTSAKKGRLHLRIPEDLGEQMHDYAKRHGTTLNAVATVLFVQLLKDEQEAKAMVETAVVFDAEQV